MSVWISYATLTLDSPDIGIVLDVFGNDPVYAWLEDEHRVDGLVLHEQTPIATAHSWLGIWPVGRIFNERADLRWEQQPKGMLHLVMISTAMLLDVFKAGKRDLQPVTDKPEHLLLWGEWRKQQPDGGTYTWNEGRIPDVGRFYPAEWKQHTRTAPRTAPRAALVTQTYEADWPEAKSVRIVTRYLRYDAAYTPPLDPRFTEKETTG